MIFDILKAIADYSGLFLSVIAIGMVCLGRYGKSARETASRDDLNKIWEAIDNGRKRLAEVEASHLSLPSHGDLAALRESITAVGTSVATLNGVVTQLNTSLTMINQHLLSGDK